MLSNKIKKYFTFFLFFFFVSIIPGKASDLEIIPINYVNGDSTLLKSNNEYLLIDFGLGGVDENVNGYFDNVINTLKDSGVTKDTPINLYLSHYHGDHWGGGYQYFMDLTINNTIVNRRVGILGYLMNEYNIEKIYLPKPYIDELETITDEDLKATMQSYYVAYYIFDAIAKLKNIDVVELETGSKFSFGNTTAEVLYLEKMSSDTNNTSLVTMFTNGKTKFLTAGDIEKEVETKLYYSDIDVSADIFKLSHHGNYATNNYSNTRAFLKKVNPKYAYVQIRYKEASPVITYEKYLKTPIETLQTFSNIYANVNLQKYKNGVNVENNNMKFVIVDDEITPIMQDNSYRITINYVDVDNSKILKTKTYDFHADEVYYLFDYKQTFDGYTLVSGEDEIIQNGILVGDITYNVNYSLEKTNVDVDNNTSNNENNPSDKDDNENNPSDKDDNVNNSQLDKIDNPDTTDNIIVYFIVGIILIIGSLFLIKKISKENIRI